MVDKQEKDRKWTSLSIFLLNCGGVGALDIVFNFELVVSLHTGRDKDSIYELGGNGIFLSIACNF